MLAWHIYPSYTDLKKGLGIMNRDFLSFGITSATEASGQSKDEVRLYQEGAREGWLKVRLNGAFPPAVHQKSADRVALKGHKRLHAGHGGMGISS